MLSGDGIFQAFDSQLEQPRDQQGKTVGAEQEQASQ
jgi:hypothetical protein